MATSKFCTIAPVAALLLFPLGAQPQDKTTEQAKQTQSTKQQRLQSICQNLDFNTAICKGSVGSTSVYVGKKLWGQNSKASLINSKDPELVKKATALKTDYKAAFISTGKTEEAAGVMAEDFAHLVGRPVVKHLATGAIVFGVYEFWQAGKAAKTSSTNLDMPKAATPEKK